MRALIVYCHPFAGSFTAAVRDLVVAKLTAAGAEMRVSDLHASGFQPVLTAEEWAGYLDCPGNRAPVAQDVADLLWCDTLIFVYPTWWYGPPALLKGWLDRVMLPDVAFRLPDAGQAGLQPGLGHIVRLGVFTTCGGSWWVNAYMGMPGRRMLMQGIGLLCARGRRSAFAAHYRMDASTPQSRARHLARVAARMDRLIGPLPVRA